MSLIVDESSNATYPNPPSVCARASPRVSPNAPARSSLCLSCLCPFDRLCISSHVAQIASFATQPADPPWQPTSIADPRFLRLPPPTPAPPLASTPPPKTAEPAPLPPSPPSSPTPTPSTTRATTPECPSPSVVARRPLAQACFLVQTQCRASIQFDVGPTERH